MKTPTLREIASACGVDVSTVSRAIANHPSLPVATRQRILSQARNMGWKQNPLASAYMSHLRSTRKPHPQGNIAFVISIEGFERFADLPAYHKNVFTGVKARATSLGYSVEAIWLRELGNDLRRLSRLLKNRGMLGAIFHGGDLPDDAFTACDCSAFAVATWGYSIRKFQAHCAAHNMAHGIRLALSIMRKRGYNRIALVQSQNLDELSAHAAPSTFLFEQGDQDAANLMYLFDSFQVGHVEQIQKWLRKKKPEAVIGDHVALEAIHGLNWRIPDDVALVSPFWGPEHAEIAGVDQRPQVLGFNVMDLLAGQIVRNERGLPEIPKLVLHQGQWNNGPSLPDRGSKPSPNPVAMPSRKRKTK